MTDDLITAGWALAILGVCAAGWAVLYGLTYGVYLGIVWLTGAVL